MLNVKSFEINGTEIAVSIDDTTFQVKTMVNGQDYMQGELNVQTAEGVAQALEDFSEYTAETMYHEWNMKEDVINHFEKFGVVRTAESEMGFTVQLVAYTEADRTLLMVIRDPEEQVISIERCELTDESSYEDAWAELEANVTAIVLQFMLGGLHA